MKQLTMLVTVIVLLVGTAQAQDSRTYRAGERESTVRLGNDPDSQESGFSKFFGYFATAHEDPGSLAREKGIAKMRKALGPGWEKSKDEVVQSAYNRFRGKRTDLIKFDRMGKVYDTVDKARQLAATRQHFASDNELLAGVGAANVIFADVFTAAGAQALVYVVGTASTGGTFLIGAAGALLANELYDRLGKPYLEERAAYYELAIVRGLLDEANDHLKNHRLDAAYAGAQKGLDGLYQKVDSDKSGILAGSPAAKSLEQEGLRIKATVIRARQLVDQVRAFLSRVLAEAQKNRFSNVRPQVKQYLEQQELLQLAGEERLIDRLLGLEKELAQIADRNAALEREKEKNKPKPSGQPTKTVLTGRGGWRDPKGKGGGVIGVTIDVEKQSFFATFQGGPGGSDITYAGEFRGGYSGDSRAGTLIGGGAVQIISRGKNVGSEAFNVNARLIDGTVGGKAIGDGRAYEFKVPVN